MNKSPNLLQWMKYFMIFCGQWKLKQKTPNLLSLIYKLNISWIYLFILEVHFTFISTTILWWECKTNVVEMVNRYFRLVGCMSITIMLKSDGRENIIALIRQFELNRFQFENKKVKNIYLKYSEVMNFILKTSIIVGAIAVANWYILGIRIQMKVTEVCPFVEGLSVQVWYPFDVHKYFWFAKTIDRIEAISTGVFVMYSKLLPMCMLVFILAKIKMLQEEMRQIDENVGNICKQNKISLEEARLYVLQNIIKGHQDVILMMKKIQSVTSIVVMIFFFTEPVNVASYILLTDNAQRRIRVALPLVIITFQLYAFSRLATEIIDESRAISDVIYNEIKWINYSAKTRRLLLMIMLRSQRQLSVKAAMFGDTSLSTFTKIMKMCYSIQTFYGAIKKTK